MGGWRYGFKFSEAETGYKSWSYTKQINKKGTSIAFSAYVLGSGKFNLNIYISQVKEGREHLFCES